MHVVTFDIDDTLIRMVGLDDTLFLQAIEAVFGLTDIEPKWDAYRYVTESGIIGELVQSRLGREVTEAEWSAFEKKSLALLVNALEANPTGIQPMPGAQAFLSRLIHDPNIAVAFATGGWRPSALIKLAAAGFDVEKIPLVSCREHPDRYEIVKLARNDALGESGARTLQSHTHVGDRVADLEAAQNTGAGFIGVTQDPDREAVFKAEGALAVIADFSEGDQLLELLNRAAGDASALLGGAE